MAGLPLRQSPSLRSLKSVSDSASVLDISASPGEYYPPPPPPFIAASPYSVEGQRPGAILSVKWISKCADIKYHPKPVDHVQVLRHFLDGTVEVKNLRTGGISTVEWDVFRPVLWHGKCECTIGGTCSCIYESYDDFQARQPREKGKNIWQYPDTFSDEGQVIGAVLVVEQKPGLTVPEPKLANEVSDRIKILKFCKDQSMIIKGRNLRTSAEGFMTWKAFREVGKREICGCENQVCHCVYNDFEASMKHQRMIKGLSEPESKEVEKKPVAQW